MFVCFFRSILVQMAYMQCVGWTWFADYRSFADLNASANRNRSATDFKLIGGPRKCYSRSHVEYQSHSICVQKQQR